MSIAITEAITMLAEAEQLQRSHMEDDSFFLEWQTNLPDRVSSEQTASDQMQHRD